MKTQAKPLIFFDQNVMEKMSKKRYKSFQSNVKNLISDDQCNIENRILEDPLFTPFGLVEFAGLKKSEIFDIKYQDQKLNDCQLQSDTEIQESLMPALKIDISNKISKQFLKSRLQEKKNRDWNYLSQYGKRYVDKYINTIDSIYDDLIQNLVLDRLSEINTCARHSPEKVRDIFTKLVIDTVCQENIMGSFRLLCKLLLELKKIKKPDNKLNKKITEILEGLKSFGDLVDCELIHLAFFGSNNRHCNCYTTDLEATIKDRLGLYCKSMNFFIQLHFDYPLYIDLEHTRPKWRCGKVCILDRETGKKIAEISSTKIYKKAPRGLFS